MTIKTSPRALLFDMDGTLTDARQPITREVLEVLKETGPGVKRYLVTGSDYVKVEEQLGTENLLNLFERVYTCNGTRVWNCNIDMDDERNIKLNKNFMVNAIITMSLSSNHMSLGNIDNVKYMYKNMTIDEVKEDFERLKDVYKKRSYEKIW